MKKVNVQSSSSNAEEGSKSELQSIAKSIFNPRGKYRNPADQEFPIIAQDNIYHCYASHLTTYSETGKQNAMNSVFTHAVNESIYSKLKECGFNVDLLAYREVVMARKLDEVLQIMENSGLSLLMDLDAYSPHVDSTSVTYDTTPEKLYRINWGYKDSYLKYLSQAATHPIIKGVLVCDEPSFLQWNGSLKDISDADVSKSNWVDAPVPTYYATAAAVPELIVYMNVACDAGQRKLIGSEIYELNKTKKEKYHRYLTQLYLAMSAGVASFHYCPIIKKVGEDGGAANPDYQVKEDYYLHLEAFAEFSAKHKMPLWNVIQSLQYDFNIKSSDKYWSYPLPTEGMLRFQVFNAIAHGADGIVYKKYASGLEEFSSSRHHDALLTVTLGTAVGSKYPVPSFAYTSAWDAAKKVNQELAKYGKKLMGLKYLDAVHVYGPKSTYKFNETREFKDSFACITGVTAGGEGIVMTNLEGSNANCLVVVNHSFKDSQNIKLDLSRDCTYPTMSEQSGTIEKESRAIGGIVTPIDKESYVRTFTLKAGGIYMLEYQKK